MAEPTILDRIGKTSLLRLRHVAPESAARILLTLESENPTGSMKYFGSYRAALAERD